MVLATSVVTFATALGALGIASYFLTLMWHRREEPTALPQFTLAVTLVAGTLVHLGVIHLEPTRQLLVEAGGATVTDLWVPLAILTCLAALALWVTFVCQYTGRGTRVTLAVTGLLGIGILAPLASLVLLIGLSGFSVGMANAVFEGGLVLVSTLALVGIFLVLDEATRMGPLMVREAAALSGAAGVLFASAFIIGPFQHPVLFTIPVALCSGLFVFTIHRYAVFESLPVARVVGRERVISEMHDAVVVVGQDGYIRDLNPSAERLFDVEREAALNDHWTALFPTSLPPETVVETDQAVRIQLDETTVALSATTIRDEHDRVLGQLLVCQDVTARRVRERRLEVLNQFLVETVCDRMGTVTDQAEALTSTDSTDEATTTETLGETIWAETTALASLVAHVREIESGLKTATEPVTRLGPLLESVAENVATERGHPRIELDDGDTTVAIEPVVLERILTLLLETGVRIPPERVELLVTDEGETVELELSTSAEVDTDGTSDAEAMSTAQLARELCRLVVETAGGSFVYDENKTQSGVPRLVIRLDAVEDTDLPVIRSVDPTALPDADGGVR